MSDLGRQIFQGREVPGVEEGRGVEELLHLRGAPVDGHSAGEEGGDDLLGDLSIPRAHLASTHSFLFFLLFSQHADAGWDRKVPGEPSQRI